MTVKKHHISVDNPIEMWYNTQYPTERESMFKLLIKDVYESPDGNTDNDTIMATMEITGVSLCRDKYYNSAIDFLTNHTTFTEVLAEIFDNENKSWVEKIPSMMETNNSTNFALGYERKFDDFVSERFSRLKFFLNSIRQGKEESYTFRSVLNETHVIRIVASYTY